MSETKESCATCRFAGDSGWGSDYVYCRRRPPICVGDAVDFPRLRAEQWCGEYEPKPDLAEGTPK